MARKLSFDALEVRTLLAADAVLADLFPGLGSSSPEFIGKLQGELYFRATTPDGVGLFSTDGLSVTPHGAIAAEATMHPYDDAILFHAWGSDVVRFTPDEGLVTLEGFDKPRFEIGHTTIYELEETKTFGDGLLTQQFAYQDVHGRTFVYEAVYPCADPDICTQFDGHQVIVRGIYGADVIVQVGSSAGDQVYFAQGAQDMWVPLGEHASGEVILTDGAPLFRTIHGIQDIDGMVLVDSVLQTFDGFQRDAFYTYSVDGTVGRIDDGVYETLVTLDPVGIHFDYFWGEVADGVVVSIEGGNLYLVQPGTITPWTHSGEPRHQGTNPPAPLLKMIEGEVAYTSVSLDNLQIAHMFRVAGLTEYFRVGDQFVFAGFDPVMGREVMVRGLTPGDANLDGVFASDDLVDLFAAGKYESDVDASWLEGDFNGDQRFDSQDLIEALASGAYSG